MIVVLRKRLGQAQKNADYTPYLLTEVLEKPIQPNTSKAHDCSWAFTLLLAAFRNFLVFSKQRIKLTPFMCNSLYVS
jgi:hypothetical protein